MLRRILVVLVACTVVLTAACGDGGDDAAGETDDTTLSTTTTSEPETTPSAPLDAAGADYCTFVAEVTAPPDGDRDATLAYLEQWRAHAPEEIRDDIGVIVEHARNGGFEGDETPPDDVQAAVEAVTKYNLEACGG